MEEIYVRGKRIKVDIRGELEKFDWGDKVRWTDEKLICPSPFRYDKTPSFFVNLKPVERNGQVIPAGTWADSGYYDEEWKSGNFIKLLAFMRNETYEETEEYLLQTYGVEYGYDFDFTPPNITLEETRKPLPKDFMKPYMFRHPYLGKRGISEKVQRIMKIGYDKESNAVVIPWLDAYGNIVNCKFRAVRGKTFWYAKNALPIKTLVYGIHVIYAKRAEIAALCEAEIDAMTWLEWGIPGLAVGGVTFTDKQASIIRRSPIKRLIISADNDKQGEKLKQAVIDKLKYDVELYVVQMPQGFKDVNEMFAASLQPPRYELYNPFEGILQLF